MHNLNVQGQNSAPGNSGQSVLATIFLLGGVIVLAASTLAFLAFTLIGSGLGFRSANAAQALASGGAHDALMHIIRDKNFSSPGGYCVPTPCVGSSATVTVVKDSPVAGQDTIVSVATVLLQQRRIRATVSVDATTGETELLSWQLAL